MNKFLQKLFYNLGIANANLRVTKSNQTRYSQKEFYNLILFFSFQIFRRDAKCQLEKCNAYLRTSIFCALNSVSYFE